MDEYALMSSLDNPHIAKTYEAGIWMQSPSGLGVPRQVLLLLGPPGTLGHRFRPFALLFR